MSLIKTHLGSMPFTDPQKALIWASKFELFTLPELPILDKSQLMIDRAIKAIDNNKPLGIFSNLLDHVDQSEVKVHCVGPATLSMVDEKYFEMHFEMILKAKAQLDKRFDKVWLCLDEPSINFVKDYNAKLKSYISNFKGEANIGIHCCDKVDISQLPIDILSFISVSQYEISDMKEYLSWAIQDNVLVLGVVKTNENYGDGQTLRLSEETNIIYSPTCGLASLNENLSDSILQYLCDLS
jgi:hypothetical protein